VDIHFHLREPGDEHKEDFYSGMCAALAGGVTTVLGVPNTTQPITDQGSLDAALALAARKAVCDFCLYLGATFDNVVTAPHVRHAVGLKMYTRSSTGTLLVDRFQDQYGHLAAYPAERVVAVHAENEEEGWRARGRVIQVYLLGQLAFAENQIAQARGGGCPVRQEPR
jgi:dihydroorotase-like cyclic amidohydrolase